MNITNINELKEKTKTLLTPKALNRLWDNIIWNCDTEEVGNSKINYKDIDLETKPEEIAKFINKKADEKIKN